MSVSVNDIKYVSHEMDTSMEKIFKKILKYYPNSQPRKLMPIKNEESCRFLLNGYVDLANTIRRCLVDEMKTYCMTFDDEDFSTDDPHILSDLVLDRIKLIPVTNFSEKLKISLNLTNTTNDVIQVTTGDIKYSGTDKLFASNHYWISHLRPGKNITIKSIHKSVGCNWKSAKGYTYLGNVHYESIGLSNKLSDNSLTHNPEKHIIGFTTKGNIDVKKVMIDCTSELIDRLGVMVALIEKYIESGKINYTSGGLNVNMENNQYTYKFLDEYLTLMNLVSYNCYLLDPGAKYVGACIRHPAICEGHIKITHTSPSKWLIDGIKKSIKDLKTVRSAFGKKN